MATSSKKAKTANPLFHQQRVEQVLKHAAPQPSDTLVYNRVGRCNKDLRHDLVGLLKALLGALGEPHVLPIDTAASFVLWIAGGHGPRLKFLYEGANCARSPAGRWTSRRGAEDSIKTTHLSKFKSKLVTITAANKYDQALCTWLRTIMPPPSTIRQEQPMPATKVDVSHKGVASDDEDGAWSSDEKNISCKGNSAVLSTLRLDGLPHGCCLTNPA